MSMRDCGQSRVLITSKRGFATGLKGAQVLPFEKQPGWGGPGSLSYRDSVDLPLKYLDSYNNTWASQREPEN